MKQLQPSEWGFRRSWGHQGHLCPSESERSKGVRSSRVCRDIGWGSRLASTRSREDWTVLWGEVTSALHIGHYTDKGTVKKSSTIRIAQLQAYQLFSLYQPLIHFMKMENMVTGQYSNFISLRELWQTDGTFRLGFKPWLVQRRVWCRWVIATIVWTLATYDRIRCGDAFFQINICRRNRVGNGIGVLVAFMFLPTSSSPYPPGEAAHYTLWSTISLSCTCSTNTVNEKSSKGKNRREQKDNDESDNRSVNNIDLD